MNRAGNRVNTPTAHFKYGEITPIFLSSVLGLIMAFVAYGRMFLKPIV